MQKNITARVLAPEFDSSLHPVIHRIYRGRGVSEQQELNLRAERLMHYQALKGIAGAVDVVTTAMQNDKHITIVGDFDADGATSTALCLLAFKMFGYTNVSYLVPNRFDFGYGLSEGIVEVAHEQQTDVIITVDNGIACLPGVTRAKSLGMQVVITDHHLPGEVLPDADAIVNPNQPGCEFGSTNLAGVGVAFYLMSACRAVLQQHRWFEQHQRPVPSMASLLDIVAVGTVADVVVLDGNNRVLVHQGLQRIRSGKCRPGIKALVEVANRDLAYLTSSDLGFVVGPRLNAAGRLEDMSLGIECLLCDDTMQARMMASELDQLNRQRREIEASMKAQAEAYLSHAAWQHSDLPAGLVVYQPDFHQGVIGIVAGRLKDKYERPTIVFAQDDNGLLKGSARSIQGVHIRDVLEHVNVNNPALIEKFGGHAMAAGLSIATQNLTAFTEQFNTAVHQAMSELGERNIIYTDGQLHSRDFTLELARLIRQAGPFGQGFEQPTFDGVFGLIKQRIVGENHLKMTLRLDDGAEIDAIAFNVDLAAWPNPKAKRIKATFQLDINVYRERESVQLLIEYLQADE